MVMKFRAHDTFFIRKGWLSKGMKTMFLFLKMKTRWMSWELAQTW